MIRFFFGTKKYSNPRSCSQVQRGSVLSSEGLPGLGTLGCLPIAHCQNERNSGSEQCWSYLILDLQHSLSETYNCFGINYNIQYMCLLVLTAFSPTLGAHQAELEWRCRLECKFMSEPVGIYVFQLWPALDCNLFGAVASGSKATSTAGSLGKIWDSNMFEPYPVFDSDSLPNLVSVFQGVRVQLETQPQWHQNLPASNLNPENSQTIFRQISSWTLGISTKLSTARNIIFKHWQHRKIVQ